MNEISVTIKKGKPSIGLNQNVIIKHFYLNVPIALNLSVKIRSGKFHDSFSVKKS